MSWQLNIDQTDSGEKTLSLLATPQRKTIQDPKYEKWKECMILLQQITDVIDDWGILFDNKEKSDETTNTNSREN